MKKLFLCLFLIFIVLMPTVAIAGQGDCDGQLQWAGSISNSGSTDPYTGFGLMDAPERWMILDIENYQDVIWIEHNIDNTSTYIYTLAGSPASASTTCTINEGLHGAGDVIGMGTIGYWRTADTFYTYIEPNSWNITGLSGDTWIYITYTPADIYNLAYKTGVSPPGYGDTPVLIHWGAVLPGTTRATGSYAIYNNVNWRNTYTMVDESTSYNLTINRNISDIPYNSKVKVVAGAVEYINETVFDSTEVSLTIFPQTRTPITIEAVDPYGRSYSATCYEASEVSIYGRVYNASNGAYINGAAVAFYQNGQWFNDSSDVEGYYEVTGLAVSGDIITVNATKAGYYYQDEFILGELINAPGAYAYNFPMTPLLGDYVSASIAGVVLGAPYQEPINGATVNISNATWSDSTTTTSTGWYFFDSLKADTYLLNASKSPSYDMSGDEPVTLIIAEYAPHNFLLTPNLDLTVTVKDVETFGLILNSSVVVGSTGQTATLGVATFTNLDPASYEVSAQADGYYPASTDKVVDDFGETLTLYLQSTTSGQDTGSGMAYPPHIVEIRLQDRWGTPYEQVRVSVNASATTLSSWGWLRTWLGIGTDPASQIQNVTMNGSTDSNGAVSFLMVETVEYTLICTNVSQGVSTTIRLYPRGDQYTFVIGATPRFLGEAYDVLDVINMSISTSGLNSSYSYINVTFNDSLNMTTNCTVFINQTNSSDYQNQTFVAAYSETDSNLTHSFLVETTGGQSYIVKFDITHTLFGNIIREFGVKFKGLRVDLGWDERIYPILSFSIIIFLGLLFTSTSVAAGSLVCCGAGWVFWGFGWLNILGLNGSLALIFASVIAILANISKRNRDEGFA